MSVLKPVGGGRANLKELSFPTRVKSCDTPECFGAYLDIGLFSIGPFAGDAIDRFASFTNFVQQIQKGVTVCSKFWESDAPL